MNRVRTALIGCGKVGRIHARALSVIPESEFCAVCDSDATRARAFAEEFNVRGYAAIEKMLKAETIEAVCVCTPHPLHAPAAIAAARHGAHILVEKPLAATLDDCDRMIEAARKNGVELGMVSQRRFFEPVERMKSAIDAGKIGMPILGTVVMLSWRDATYYTSDPWRGKWATEGGGVLVNQAPHHLDLLQWFMGPVDEITGYAKNLNHPTVEVEDTAVGSLRFRNGGLGSIVVSLCQRPGIYSKVHVHGSNGASVGVQTDTGATFIAGMSEMGDPAVNDLWTVPGEEEQLAQWVADDRRQFVARRDPDYYHKLQVRDFLQSVIAGKRPRVTAENGRTVVEIFQALYLSNRESRPIRLPLS
jgi:predicted dehydrogenase